jgi:AraC-like DNA-binding protein
MNLLQATIAAASGVLPLDRLAEVSRGVPTPPTPALDAFLRGIALKCLSERVDKRSPGHAYRLIKVIDEIVRMGEADFRKLVAAIRKLTGVKLSGIPRSIKDYVDAHYATKLTLDSVSYAFGVDAEDANSSFRQAFQYSIHDYMSHVRTQKAIALIKAGEKVEVAALMVGWKGKRHLYREIKRFVGMTPAALRATEKARCNPRRIPERGPRLHTIKVDPARSRSR